ncbi:glycosyltransferase family 2 protein [Rhizohabitans arisaemae]|uniref:glycosyltransferase family 2 protein n=1 Tax=Rhizohabitans arisaemae TaxID=2720610 RepID=UPI0024B1F882|nr:glycosyltransferase family 2 protein [Rhizohabitans arisaemae]
MSVLSVIVLTYRSAAYVGRCLAALTMAMKDLDAELIVVDNASGDDTVEVVRRVAPMARVLARDVNDGFAGGCHAGADMAKGDRLLFVNPDAEVEPDALEALLECAARHPRAGIVGGRMVTDEGRTDPRSWWGKPSLWSVLCFGLGLNTVFPGSAIFDRETPRPWSGDPGEVRQVPIVTGAMMLISRSAWERLGGFDKAIFMYGEDADLCIKAARHGYRPVVTARAVYRHPSGMSSSSLGKLTMLFTGKATLVRRHLPFGFRHLGIRLVLAGVWLRAQASKRITPPGIDRQGRPTAKGEDWISLWKSRSTWHHGWDDGRGVRPGGA